MRQHHKFIELGDFVVMPNHIHGILILDNGWWEWNGGDGDGGIGDDVETGYTLSLRQQQQQQQQQPSTQPQTIGQKRFQNIGKKHGFINNWILQIGRNKTCQID